MNRQPSPHAVPAPQAQIGFGKVRHSRLRPVQHAFVYPTYFLMLPLRTLAHTPCAALARNRAGLLSFYDSDHGDGRSAEQGGALAWVVELLHSQGICDARGEVWLQCYPRVLGTTFKPVSFWYCHTASGSLRAIVVEVNNTFGQRHVYLLEHPRWGVEQSAAKVFHVSPFCAVQGSYRFRFMSTPERSKLVARIDYDDDQGPLLHTALSGSLQPYTLLARNTALRRYGAMTLAVVARIHWQALRLWLARVPIFKKPQLPADLVTR